jgi:hypothetical protein
MRRLLAVLLASTTFIASCGRGDQQPTTAPPSPQQLANWPEKLDEFRFLWSAEPGINLVNGNAVPVRAYLESWLVIYYTRDVDAAYPGYLRATPEYVQPWSDDWLRLPEPQRMIRAFLGGIDDPNERIFGNEDLHILRIEPINAGFRAFVCDATYRVYRQSTGSTSLTPLWQKSATTPDRIDESNMGVWRIEFTDRDPRISSAPPAAPTQPQQGPLPAPRTDVFGPWFVTGSATVEFWWDTDNPGLVDDSPEEKQRRDDARDQEDAMRQECLDRYPVDATQRFKLATTVLDSPPPVEPATPGWPDTN